MSPATLSYHARKRAAEILQRPLVKGEIVHHRNRNPRDNRARNLQVMTRSSHMRLHHLQGDIHVLTPEEHRRGRRLGGLSRWYSDEQILEELRSVAKQSTQSRLTCRTYAGLRSLDSACVRTCLDRFGSWNRAKELAGVL